MSEERHLEIKVGLLLVTALLGVVGLFYLMGEFRLEGARIDVDLTHSGSIPRGAPVRMAGVRVGHVKEIKLFPERVDEQGRSLAVRMALEIDREIFAQLREGVRVEFATQGPLGEPYIELVPGAPSAPPLQPGVTLRAYPPRLDQLMPKLIAVLDTAQALLGEIDGDSVRTLLGEVRLVASLVRKFLDTQGPAIEETLASLGRVSKTLETLTTRGSKLLAPKGDLNTALTDLAALTSSLREELPAVTGKAQVALDDMARLTSSITPDDLAALQQTLREAEVAGKKLNELIERTEKILDDVSAGKGTLGALVKDEALYEDLRTLITELKAKPWRLLWKN
ncbi:MAG: MlaD family protein [Myxococcales bacterium]|jgi:phospholipid/cholesterol/gamma-HCH transport system substrate-binding protein|nr:MlaD family protein [Myxococcales bacterium]